MWLGVTTSNPNSEVYHEKKNNQNAQNVNSLEHSKTASSTKNAVTTALGQGTTPPRLTWLLKVFFKNLPRIKTFISIIKWLLGFVFCFVSETYNF